MADLHAETHRYRKPLRAADGLADDCAGWDVRVAGDPADSSGELLWSRQQIGLSR